MIEVKGGEEVEYVNEKPYTLKTIAFASDYVAEEVTKRLKSSILNRLHIELEVSLSDNASNPYLGSYFEQMAH